MFCVERLGKIKFKAFPKHVDLQILSLESVDYFGTSELYWAVEKKVRIFFSKTAMVSCYKLPFCANASCDKHAVYFWWWLIWLEFSCIYTHIKPATTDIFSVHTYTLRIKILSKGRSKFRDPAFELSWKLDLFFKKILTLQGHVFRSNLHFFFFINIPVKMHHCFFC